MEVLFSVLSFSLSLLFFLSGLAKIGSMPTFVRMVRAYRLWPRLFEKRLFAYAVGIVPVLEMSGAIAILFPKTFVFGISLLTVLSCLFTVLIHHALKHQKAVSCGCYGAFLEARADGFTLGKVLFLLGLCILLLFGRDMFVLTFSGWTVAAAIGCTALFLFMQFIWIRHQDHMRTLQNRG
jgi:hypothetical protein